MISQINYSSDCLQEPPAAALEFLVKIREVIAIAKHKMAAKRFQPILNQIPEEETFPSNGNSLDIYQGMGSQRSGSIVSLKRENSRNKNCIGCPGCKTDGDNDIQQIAKYNIPACVNCLSYKGDKQNSIRKWLENIPTTKQHSMYNDFLPTNQNGLAESLLSLPPSESRRKVRKQNSFSSSNSMYLTDNFSVPKKSSTLSVRSEPMMRNYNIPLPEFENPDNQRIDFNLYCQTVGRVDDIRPIGLNDYRSVSLRNAAQNTRISKPFTNKNALPDMVNEAIALDHCTKSYNLSSSDDERISNRNSTIPIQSPFTRNTSESPSGNDYETDSLERSTNKKGLLTPTDYPDVPSSQASPSLSSALPLEEELTMRNAVYKIHSSSNSNTPSPHREVCIDNHYETIEKHQPPPFETPKASLVSEVYVNNTYNFGSTPTSPSGSECSMGSRKLVTTINEAELKPGCLTIEVKDPPENYIKIHESDGFEPDTLDRKHPKHKDAADGQFSRKDLIKSIDKDDSPPVQQRIQLRSSGTFQKTNDKVEYATKFNSLRHEYEQRKNGFDRPKLCTSIYSGSKSLEDTTEDWQEAEEWTTEEGRILTLELRHSKRQRQSTPPTIKQLKNLARPDVLPPLPPTDEDPIYEQPIFPPRKVEMEIETINEIHQKNASGRSLSPRVFTKNLTTESTHDSSITSESHYGRSCSPMRASVQSQSSEYENMESASGTVRKAGDLSRNVMRKRSGRSGNINTNTFVKGPKLDGHSKARFRRKKGFNIQDSGYLSSDSTSSRQVPRKLVIAKIVSCSESDDTENEARSESGAESIETHSVYFDSFRKMQTEVEDDLSYSSKSFSDVNGKFKHSDDCS